MKSSLVSRVVRSCAPAVLLFATIGVRAHAQDKRVVVVDRASSPILEFHATPTGEEDWGDDLLGRAVIGVGRFRMVDVEDGSPTCYYDFKAVLANGGTAFRYHVDVCSTESWTVTN